MHLDKRSISVNVSLHPTWLLCSETWLGTLRGQQHLANNDESAFQRWEKQIHTNTIQCLNAPYKPQTILAVASGVYSTFRLSKAPRPNSENCGVSTCLQCFICWHFCALHPRYCFTELPAFQDSTYQEDCGWPQQKGVEDHSASFPHQRGLQNFHFQHQQRHQHNQHQDQQQHWHDQHQNNRNHADWEERNAITSPKFED